MNDQFQGGVVGSEIQLDDLVETVKDGVSIVGTVILVKGDDLQIAHDYGMCWAKRWQVKLIISRSER